MRNPSDRWRSPAAGLARRAGFTILEVAITTLLASLVLGSVVTIIFQSELFLAHQTKQYTLDQTGRRIMERLSEELRAVEPTTVLPVLMADSDYVQYQKVVGYTGSEPMLSPLITIGLELARGEIPNGADDNNDGRADESFVTYTELGSNTIRLGGGVLGMRFNSLGNGLTVDVDIAVVDRGGNLIVKTFSRTITYRN